MVLNYQASIQYLVECYVFYLITLVCFEIVFKFLFKLDWSSCIRDISFFPDQCHQVLPLHKLYVNHLFLVDNFILTISSLHC